MSDSELDFEGALEHIRSLLGNEASVEILSRDPEGAGTVVELTGVLRAIDTDPSDAERKLRGPRMFGFEGQANAFYVDPDAFLEAHASGAYLRITTSFGALIVAGPIQRPEWF